MPWKHLWHAWLTRHWDEHQWSGWEGTLLRCTYLTIALFATLLVAPSLLSLFVRDTTMGSIVSLVVFALYSWVLVGHYPEPVPED
jgi:hypothetical protein